MRKISVLLVVVLLGGCVSDHGSAPSVAASAKGDPDQPKQLCESTLEGNQPKTICY